MMRLARKEFSLLMNDGISTTHAQVLLISVPHMNTVMQDSEQGESTLLSHEERRQGIRLAS